MDQPEPLELDPPEYEVYNDGGPAWLYVVPYLLIVLPIVVLILHRWGAF